MFDQFLAFIKVRMTADKLPVILLCDDQESNLTEVITKMGFPNLTRVKNGIQCLTNIVKKEYSHLIIRHNLPVMSGPDTVRRIPQAILDKLTIIYIVEAGVTVKERYIHLPMDPQDVVKLLRQ